MENFLGYGTCDSAYDGRRHIACLLTVYASYKMQVNPNVLNFVRSALDMTNYMQSHQYLLQNLYDSDFYQFVESLGYRYNISNQDLTYLSSSDLFKVRMIKTPAGYDRVLNKVLVVHFAYLQRYYRPLNPIVLQQLIDSFCIPILKGVRGGFTESEIRKIFSIVNTELMIGNTDLKTIEIAVAKQI